MVGLTPINLSNIEVIFATSCSFLDCPVSADDSSTLCKITLQCLLLLSFSSSRKVVITSEVALLQVYSLNLYLTHCRLPSPHLHLMQNAQYLGEFLQVFSDTFVGFLNGLTNLYLKINVLSECFIGRHNNRISCSVITGLTKPVELFIQENDLHH